jgi:hypothetical protein
VLRFLKKEIGAILLVFISLSIVSAHGQSVGPNVDITLGNDTNSRQQVEPTIAVHPSNPNIIVAGAQDLRLLPQGGHRWHGYYRSVDGGQTWSASLLPGFPGDTSPDGVASPLRRFDLTSDPVLAFDRNGNVYYTGIAVKLDQHGNVRFSSLRAFVAKYVNDGATYAGVTMVQGSGADKPWIAVDTSTGPRDGHVYLVFDLSNVVFSRSTDGGKTFSRPQSVTGKTSSALPGVAVDPAGNVFVSSLDGSLTLDEPLPRLRVSKSVDGGLTFNAVTVSSVTILPSPLPGNGFRTFTIPQIAADGNGAYVVWDDFRSGDSDVLFSRSTDGGTSWSLPARVNDVTLNHQFFPSVAATTGRISIIWYDSRLDDGGAIENLDVFYSQSVDGVTFTSSLRVTDMSFNPNLVRRTDPPGTSQVFMGDYIQVSANPTAVHAIWADNRNACGNVDPVFGCVDQDVFTATIIP